MKKETLAQVFSCEFCEISKNTLFTEHLRTTAFENAENAVRLFILVSQEPNLEQDLIITKVHTSPVEKNVKYHSSVFINIMGNTVIMVLNIDISH